MRKDYWENLTLRGQEKQRKNSVNNIMSFVRMDGKISTKRNIKESKVTQNNKKMEDGESQNCPRPDS